MNGLQFSLLLMVLAGGAAVLPTAHAQDATTYHRFWRGTRRSDVSAADFQSQLNSVFLPATVKTGAGQGLVAYEPVLLNGEDGLPDEVALVSYENEAKYQALMLTDAGKAYGALHAKLFDLTQSHSVVPVAYAGNVEIETAYDTHADFAAWQAGRTMLWVGFRHPNETDASYLARFQREIESPAADHVALAAQNYWLDYVSTVPGHITSADADLLFPFDAGGLGGVQLVPGRGVNLQFAP